LNTNGEEILGYGAQVTARAEDKRVTGNFSLGVFIRYCVDHV